MKVSRILISIRRLGVLGLRSGKTMDGWDGSSENAFNQNML